MRIAQFARDVATQRALVVSNTFKPWEPIEEPGETISVSSVTRKQSGLQVELYFRIMW